MIWATRRTVAANVRAVVAAQVAARAGLEEPAYAARRVLEGVADRDELLDAAGVLAVLAVWVSPPKGARGAVAVAALDRYLARVRAAHARAGRPPPDGPRCPDEPPHPDVDPPALEAR